MDEKRKQKAFRAGLIVMIILAILTAVEYILGLFAGGLWILLILIALVKAFFVVRDYMHLPLLFASEEENIE